jgi:hypothetical protein
VANSRSLADDDCTKGTSTEVPFVDVAFQCSKPKKGYIMADYATLLRDHITLTCRSIDRIFLQAYVPKL